MKITKIKNLLEEINIYLDENEIELKLNKYKLNKIKNTKILSNIFRHGLLFDFENSIQDLQKSYNNLNKNYQIPENGILDLESIDKINNYKFYKNLYKTLMIHQGTFLIELMNNKNTEIVKYDFFSGEIDIKYYFRVWVDSF